MPFTMKIQPIDSHVPEEETRLEPVRPIVKSRLKRLFERQFSSVLRNSSAEKITDSNNGSVDFEPSLAKMVQNFMEENHDKHAVPLSWFNSYCDVSADTESHTLGGGFAESTNQILKGLVACASVFERNLLTDTAKIIEKNKMTCKRKNDCIRIVTEGLIAIGYDASICKSRWEKSPFCPAGEYEYIDVIIGNERLIVEVDFRSEFEIARSTKTYKAILQTLPYVFVGKCDRLQRIVAIVSEAAKQSLKKKGLHVPPWRKVEYVTAKWRSPYTRTTPPMICRWSRGIREEMEYKQKLLMGIGRDMSEPSHNELGDSMMTRCQSFLEKDEEKPEKVVPWKPPVLKLKSSQSGVKVVTGLAAVFRENP